MLTKTKVAVAAALVLKRPLGSFAAGARFRVATQME